MSSKGLAEGRSLPHVEIFADGVGRGGTTNGGRVLNVTGLGADVTQARTRAYQAVGMIEWPGIQYRRDIGLYATA